VIHHKGHEDHEGVVVSAVPADQGSGKTALGTAHATTASCRNLRVLRALRGEIRSVISVRSVAKLIGVRRGKRLYNIRVNSWLKTHFRNSGVWFRRPTRTDLYRPGT